MIKRALIGTAIAAMLGTFVFGRDFFSYAKTAGNSVRDAVKSEVPLEFEIERARKMVENLVPDIRNCMHVMAEQQVDIDHLEADIARKDDRLDSQREAILALRADLDSGKDTFVYASRRYTPDDVKRDLAQRFERFKVAEESLQRDQQILSARKKALAANQEKLEGLLNSKQELEVQMAQLEARLKTLQAAETVSTLEIDDSQLSRAKQLIRDLNKQIDVRERMLDAEGKFTGLIPVEDRERDLDDVATDIDEYFGRTSSIRESIPVEAPEL